MARKHDLLEQRIDLPLPLEPEEEPPPSPWLILTLVVGWVLLLALLIHFVGLPCPC